MKDKEVPVGVRFAICCVCLDLTHSTVLGLKRAAFVAVEPLNSLEVQNLHLGICIPCAIKSGDADDLLEAAGIASSRGIEPLESHTGIMLVPLEAMATVDRHPLLDDVGPTDEIPSAIEHMIKLAHGQT